MFLSRSLKALCLTASVSVAALAGATHAAEPFTYKDMLMLDRLSGLQVDSSGTYAVFQVRATDMEKNKGVTSLWIKDLSAPATAERKLAISEGGASNPQWSADGKTLYFVSSRSGSDQVWKTEATGATATQVTSLALDVQAYQPTPDGKGVVVALAVFPECKGAEIDCTVTKQAEAKAQKSTGVVYTKLFVRHWDTWADGTRNHLFYVPFGGAAVSLTDGVDGDVPSKPFGDEAEFTVSPDSQTVYYSVRIAGKTEPWSTNFDLYSVPVTGGEATNLTEANLAWDTSPRLSLDGKTLAYKAMKRPGFEADRFDIFLRDLKTGKVTAVAGDWDRSVDDLKWAKDGKSLLVTAGDVGLERLFRIDIKSGKVMALSKDGHIDAFAETGGSFVYLKSAMNSPSQLYAANSKAMFIDMGARNLTGLNPVLKERAFGDYEQFNFKGWNGETVHGYVVKPANYEEGKTYPVAFLIHGGPQGSFGDSWSYRWNPQSYAGEGFAVVMIDFHGSTGYGQAFTDSISQHWGDRPLEDLQKGWAFALGQYKFLDGDRACALGASYGGYMVNWIAGQWKEPWKCLVEHDGIFDTRTMAEETEELWFSEWENGGMPYGNMAKMDEFNPALHAHKWSVPQLVIHSDKDYRVVPGQGIATFTALQRQGIESAFLRFPDENHWVLKPQNSMKWHATVFDWLKAHTAEDAK
ncbi:prolyl oligopeptidase family protein [Asticcacaulis biprosthecium C19]|uniref:Prolyl oligopeptidase family protein n=1 Tax=Asticcacaulis biprosthecium C19 TaxID=715226 RepID=F4QNH3_9CAUL|nr:S9 family peptidase [Asticcacaulis biprosthecium]EGF90881.1 prolyl oligopeptidase family protein [Asticcacaulis biprosthecium C19]